MSKKILPPGKPCFAAPALFLLSGAAGNPLHRRSSRSEIERIRVAARVEIAVHGVQSRHIFRRYLKIVNIRVGDDALLVRGLGQYDVCLLYTSRCV